MPQQDKIKYFNFLLENDINFSRDESGNYVALVKVLNPAFYGGADAGANPNMTSTKKEDTKVRADKNKSGARKSMPKNVSSQPKAGNFNKNTNNNSLGFEVELIRNKKKNPNKSNEHFEKDKKIVSYIYI